MKWPAFGYARPTSLGEVWPLLDCGGTVLAGGQSLLATLAFRLSEPSRACWWISRAWPGRAACRPPAARFAWAR